MSVCPLFHALLAQFVNLACRGYTVLRQNAQLIITLLSLMLSCGIPELRTEADLGWLLDALCIGQNDDEAELHFRGLITEAMHGAQAFLTRALMDSAHIMMHG